jgi:cysteinyl-tRNA synthetase
MKVFNTLSGKKEEFLPQGDPIKMYVCGVTPYSECHIGHAMSYIVFDVIRRYLEFRGYRVKYVQNFTDVDDKIIARSNQLGVSARELAEGFIDQYFADMDALNVKRADIYPRATEEIPKIIEVIEGLIEKGHAYNAGSDVYFRVQSFHGYGKLSHRSIDEMRVTEEMSGKEHPMDFTLWKGAKPGEPSWESPWGVGRPGWHIECSAMCLKYLGETADIHGGGQDLVFPHHENEIAQSEAFSGSAPFVKYWLHNGLVQLGEEKMSKSLGNLITVEEALEHWSPDALRLFVLSSHYRSPLTYSEEGLEAAEKGVERLCLVVHRGSPNSSRVEVEVAPYRERFIEAMDDDFNTAQAIAILFDLAREINRAAEAGSAIDEAQKMLTELASVLGLTLEEVKSHLDVESLVPLLTEVRAKLSSVAPALEKEVFGQGRPVAESVPEMGADAIISSLVEARTKLRARREFDFADKIRQNLAELGIILEDTDKGTIWRYRR